MLENILEFMPIAVFGLVYYLFGMFAATAAFMGASIFQVVMLKVFRQAIAARHWVGLGLSVFFGGLTLLFRDPRFIMWKPSILYWIFAIVLLVSFRMGRNLIRSMQESRLEGLATLSDRVWRNVLYAWVILFLLMGALNLLVASYFSEQSWVLFKLVGFPIMMMVFVFGQIGYLIWEGKRVVASSVVNEK